MKAVVDEAGRILLPEPVRAALGIKPGDEILLETRAGEWVLKPSNSETGLAWEGTVLVHKGTSLPTQNNEDLIDETRNERYQQLSEGFTQ